MSNMNQVVVTGNLTADPELRATSNGTAVLEGRIAVNQYNGKEEVPHFFTWTIFGKRAEGLASFLKKGAKVAILGRLNYQAWETNGQRRSRVTIVAREIEPMSKSQGSDNTVADREDVIDVPPEELIPGLYDEDAPF